MKKILVITSQVFFLIIFGLSLIWGILENFIPAIFMSLGMIIITHLNPKWYLFHTNKRKVRLIAFICLYFIMIWLSIVQLYLLFFK